MFGKILILLLLIGILSFGGIVWFDYLNLIDAKTVLAPVYKHIPFLSGQPRTQPPIEADDFINLDAERLAIRLLALELQKMEMDSKERDITSRTGEIEQMAQELQIRQQTLDDIEKSLAARGQDANDKDRNIEQNARNLVSMPPRNAVNIIAALDNQLAIDVIRKTEEIARNEGTQSIVPYWFSLMEPERAAELQRLMAGRP